VAADQIRRGIESFRALPHRLESVGTVGGATYFNDSIATSPERSIAALCSFSEPIVLLAGGRDKHLPMQAWAQLIRERAHHLIVFSEAASLIAGAAREAGVADEAIVAVQTLEQAVDAAARVARPGDAVLLSPGCTSYDAFFDFEARGDRFRELVALIAEERA
jgi:UDP-N-acetylmuramoylalanine--D-glutamate ligase